MDVLGNMACTLAPSYIQNSDPFILEKLKSCENLSDDQVAAMQTLLLSGTTQYRYGDPFKSSGMLHHDKRNGEHINGS